MTLFNEPHSVASHTQSDVVKPKPVALVVQQIQPKSFTSNARQQMSSINDLKVSRNKLLQEAQAMLLGSNVTSEIRTNVDKMIADSDVLERDIATLEKIAKVETEERARTTPPRPTPGADAQTEETAELRAKKQKKAFSDFVRFGQTDEAHRGYLKQSAEYRDLGVGTVAGSITGGNQLVPEAFYPVLVEAQKAWGGLLNIVNTRRTDNGAPMKVALMDDTAQLVSVIGEATPVSENDPVFSGVTVSTDMVTTGVVKITLPELQDSYFDIDAFMRNNFGKRWYRGLNNMVTAGNSSNVASIVTGATSVVTAASATAISYGEVVGLYAGLDPAYIDSAYFSMNSTTRGYLLGVVDGFGRPLYIPNPTSGAFDSLLGRPVILNQALDNITAAKKPILFGDCNQGYLFRIAQDMAVVRLNERYMDQLSIGLIGYGRVGGVSTDAGSHPIVSLTTHA